MTILFPNPSRSFDESKNRVHFWGYDKTIEVSFYVQAETLKKLCPDMDEAESGCLAAFDQARTKLYDAAEKAYTRKRAFSFILAPEHV